MTNCWLTNYQQPTNEKVSYHCFCVLLEVAVGYGWLFMEPCFFACVVIVIVFVIVIVIVTVIVIVVIVIVIVIVWSSLLLLLT